jgi:hypothetical protein
LQWWQKHCQELHKQRLRDIKAMVDVAEPESAKYKLSNAKKEQMAQTRQNKINYVSSGRRREQNLQLLKACIAHTATAPMATIPTAAHNTAPDSC